MYHGKRQKGMGKGLNDPQDPKTEGLGPNKTQNSYSFPSACWQTDGLLLRRDPGERCTASGSTRLSGDPGTHATVHDAEKGGHPLEARLAQQAHVVLFGGRALLPRHDLLNDHRHPLGG